MKKVDDNQISLLDLLKEVPKEWDAEFMDKATQNIEKLLKEFNINESESIGGNKEWAIEEEWEEFDEFSPNEAQKTESSQESTKDSSITMTDTQAE